MALAILSDGITQILNQNRSCRGKGEHSALLLTG